MIVLLGSIGCQEEGNNKRSAQKSIQEIPAEGSIADIIRNPVSAGQEVDTTNLAQLQFGESNFDFGKVKAGEVIEHTFPFTNSGKAPLVITDARSTCGCTVPSWPKDPIPPGGGGEILVHFNTKNKKGYQDKPVTIIANTNPTQTILRMRGTVEE